MARKETKGYNWDAEWIYAKAENKYTNSQAKPGKT